MKEGIGILLFVYVVLLFIGWAAYAVFSIWCASSVACEYARNEGQLRFMSQNPSVLEISLYWLRSFFVPFGWMW